MKENDMTDEKITMRMIAFVASRPITDETPEPEKRLIEKCQRKVKTRLNCQIFFITCLFISGLMIFNNNKIET